MSYPLYPADPDRDPAEPFRNLEPASSTASTAVIDPAPRPWDDPVDDRPITIEEVAERQREAFGGPKIGSAFFGWLTATATAAILAGVVVIVTAVIGLDVIPDPWATGGIGPFDGLTVGWIVIGTILAIVFASFYCGGYVAGRMARFSGAAQGLAVWGWAVVVGIAAAVAIGLLDGRFGFVAAGRDAVPGIPVPVELVTIAWIGAAVALVLASLGGAVLGGAVGVRYHRRVDRVGLDD